MGTQQRISVVYIVIVAAISHCVLAGEYVKKSYFSYLLWFFQHMLRNTYWNYFFSSSCRTTVGFGCSKILFYLAGKYCHAFGLSNCLLSNNISLQTTDIDFYHIKASIKVSNECIKFNLFFKVNQYR